MVRLYIAHHSIRMSILLSFIPWNNYKFTAKGLFDSPSDFLLRLVLILTEHFVCHYNLFSSHDYVAAIHNDVKVCYLLTREIKTFANIAGDPVLVFLQVIRIVYVVDKRSVRPLDRHKVPGP